jgi:putative tricarboxylic transport membrane protein
VTAPPDAGRAPRAAWTGPRIAGGVLLALGVAALLATFDVSSARDGWSISGPRFAPLLASGALILLSLTFLIRTVVRPDEDLAQFAAEAMEGTDWRAAGLLLGLLIGYAVLLTALGYALATTIFFWLTAWLLGSQSPVRDVLVGLVLGVVASYAFTEWLNVQLPAGPWGV